MSKEKTTYTSLAIYAQGELSRLGKEDHITYVSFCEDNDLRYSTLTKFMTHNPRDMKRRIYKAFLIQLLEALGKTVTYSHSVHYFNIKQEDLDNI